jgi:hypothetical protein
MTVRHISELKAAQWYAMANSNTFESHGSNRGQLKYRVGFLYYGIGYAIPVKS